MKPEQAFADIELKFGDKVVKVKGLVDTGASRSVISKRLADELGTFTPLKKPYRLKTANESGELEITGFINVEVKFQGVEVPGGARFEVAKNLREGLDLIIGRPEIDSWDITFTPRGPIPRRVPIEFEVI